jgi:hypothetical protein
MVITERIENYWNSETPRDYLKGSKVMVVLKPSEQDK